MYPTLIQVFRNDLNVDLYDLNVGNIHLELKKKNTDICIYLTQKPCKYLQNNF